MSFEITCSECGSTDVQPFYEDACLMTPNKVGLNCRDCGHLLTMPELQKEWLAAIRKEKAGYIMKGVVD